MARDMQNQDDPFPKIFIVCGVIAAVFFAIVLTALFWDISRRNQLTPLGPPEAVTSPAAGQIQLIRTWFSER